MKKMIRSFAPKYIIDTFDAVRNQRNERVELSHVLAGLNIVKANAIKLMPHPDDFRILVVPADPQSLIGSLGDEAMITALIENAKKYNSSLQVDIITSRPKASEFAVKNGYLPHEIMENSDYVERYTELLEERKYSAIFVVGADTLDGHYSKIFSARMIAAAAIAGHLGVSSTIMGFSLNTAPSPELKPFFDGLPEDVRINIRDPMSLDRFKKFSTAKARLVADAAFQLLPGEIPGDPGQWIKSQRAEGRTVVGFNVHPMLLKQKEMNSEDLLISKSAEILESISKMRKVSWLLLPHDYRPIVGDSACLKRIHDSIKGTFGKNVFFLDGEHNAGNLKATAASLDGVLTARMHLAIAALGSGVPAFSIAYQGKFEGLYKHFDLPADQMLSPAEFKDTDNALPLILSFIDKLADTRAQVQSKLPEVRALSMLNFETLDFAPANMSL